MDEKDYYVKQRTANMYVKNGVVYFGKGIKTYKKESSMKIFQTSEEKNKDLEDKNKKL
jgi:hypothetical protein